MNWLKNLLSGERNDLAPDHAARLAGWRRMSLPDLDAPHLQTRYVVVDIEASGLDQKKDRLISIGAVAIDEGTICASDAFEVVLRQQEVSDAENILIHGIGADAQRDGVEPAEAMLRFLEYVGKAPLVAYHAFFDQGMIDQGTRQFLGGAQELIWHDLAWLLPELCGERISGIVGLDDWLGQFGIRNYRRHNAVSDCLATAQLFQIAMRRATGAGLDTSRKLSQVERARRSLRRS